MESLFVQHMLSKYICLASQDLTLTKVSFDDCDTRNMDYYFNTY